MVDVEVVVSFGVWVNVDVLVGVWVDVIVIDGCIVWGCVAV